MSLTMHAPQALPPTLSYAVPFVTGGLVYTAASTLARMVENSHATHYGVVFGCSVVALLLPTMVIIHQQTVTALARRDMAAFEATRKVDLGQLQPIPVQHQEVPNFLDAVNGWHASTRFEHATPEQTLALARMIAGGAHNLACNRLRAIGFRDPQIDRFRPELRDRGFAVESKGRYFLTDAGIAHFCEIARQADPHPGRGWRK
jgi:hypothetical protein